MARWLGLIVARRDSRRLPGKNKLDLGGRGLFEWTIRAAQDSGCFDDVLMSTNDPDILGGAREYGISCHERPDHLADDATSVPEMLLQLMEQEVISGYDALCVLTPCHPFRTGVHVAAAVEMFSGRQEGFLVTVSEYPSPPEYRMSLENDVICDSGNRLFRKAELTPSYYPNGALVCLDCREFKRQRTFYGERTLGMILPWPHALDIDTREDYDLARRLCPVLLPETSAEPRGRKRSGC